MSLTDNVNLVIGISGWTVSALGFLQSVFSYHMDRQVRRYFIAFFCILSVYVLFNLMGQATGHLLTPGWAAFSRFTLYAESALSSVLTVMLTALLLYQCGENWRHAAVFRLCVLLWAIYIVELTGNLFSGAFYRIDDSNLYWRGPLYPLLLVPVVLIMAVNLAALWQRLEKLNRRQKIAFTVYCLAPLVSMLVQMLFYGVYTIVLGSAVGAMVMFIYIQNDQAERYYAQQAENAQLKIDILLSQIQPHFLFNALGTIRWLCDHDPRAAGEMTEKFSRYLQGNMSVLRQEGLIPFSAELEHTRIYLEIEKLRFEDKLQIVYDIACTDFSLPTLTLQPLVENAVRHGVRGRSGTGTVTISTRETPEHWEITVADDGPGFDPQAPRFPDDGRAHIGISNVRHRLAQVCGGTLSIRSAPGAGTAAVIAIPKKQESLL